MQGRQLEGIHGKVTVALDSKQFHTGWKNGKRMSGKGKGERILACCEHTLVIPYRKKRVLVVQRNEEQQIRSICLRILNTLLLLSEIVDTFPNESFPKWISFIEREGISVYQRERISYSQISTCATVTKLQPPVSDVSLGRSLITPFFQPTSHHKHVFRITVLSRSAVTSVESRLSQQHRLQRRQI